MTGYSIVYILRSSIWEMLLRRTPLVSSTMRENEHGWTGQAIGVLQEVPPFGRPTMTGLRRRYLVV